MRSVFLAVPLALVSVFPAAAAPQIYTNGIVNGASFIWAGLPNGSIAQGSIFSIFGTDLGPAALAGANYPLPAAQGLAGVRVDVKAASANNAVPAILLMVSAGQINAILPSSVPAGSATVTVTYNGATGNSQQITVVRGSFGTFSINGRGNGPALMVNGDGQTQNSVADAAHPGDAVTLWGTGLGGVTFDETRAPGANAKDMTAQNGVKVYVGGVEITPQYAGRAPEVAGVDQVRFQLPAAGQVPEACYVPLIVKVNGIVSNSTTMAIASPQKTACSDEISNLDLDNLDTGAKTGNILLSRVTSFVNGSGLTLDSATAAFTSLSPDALRTIHGRFGVSAYGTCTVYTYAGGDTSFLEAAPVTYLDAGGALTLTLPDSTTRALSRTLGSDVYSLQADLGTPPAPLLDQTGTYRIAAPGGTNIAAFTASLNVPAPINWTNRTSITAVDRTQPLRVTWTGGNASDIVVIAGHSSTAADVGAAFLCIEKASQGQFTVPADVLAGLPPSAQGNATSGILAVGNYTAPANATVAQPPSGLDLLTFSYQFLTASPAAFR